MLSVYASLYFDFLERYNEIFVFQAVLTPLLAFLDVPEQSYTGNIHAQVVGHPKSVVGN